MAKAKKYPSMSAEEKEDWWALDDYVRHNIMEYTDQGLNKTMTLMLKGLRFGQDIANNNIHKRSNYSFKTILHTFMACSYRIKQAVAKKKFKDDTAKFAYIMGIVNREIVNVYNREQDMKMAKYHHDNIDTSTIENVDMSKIYEKKKQEAKEQKTAQSKNKYNDLW